jgi:hypothetical protein
MTPKIAKKTLQHPDSKTAFRLTHRTMARICRNPFNSNGVSKRNPPYKLAFRSSSGFEKYKFYKEPRKVSNASFFGHALALAKARLRATRALSSGVAPSIPVRP